MGQFVGGIIREKKLVTLRTYLKQPPFKVIQFWGPKIEVKIDDDWWLHPIFTKYENELI